MSRGSLPRICRVCGAGFWSHPSRVRRGGAKFCSSACSHKGRSRAWIAPLEDRLRAGYTRVSEDECWVWMRARNNHGYGQIGHDRKVVYAHRVSWELHHGRPVPDGKELDHLCRNPPCVNPSHLEAVTHRENCLRGARWPRSR